LPSRPPSLPFQHLYSVHHKPRSIERAQNRVPMLVLLVELSVVVVIQQEVNVEYSRRWRLDGVLAHLCASPWQLCRGVQRGHSEQSADEHIGLWRESVSCLPRCLMQGVQPHPFAWRHHSRQLSSEDKKQRGEAVPRDRFAVASDHVSTGGP